MQKTFDLAGSKIVVTGANGFLGQVICNTLRFEGAEVIGIDICEAKSVSTNTELYIIKKLDITNKNHFADLKDFITSTYNELVGGYIDGLINNAAVSFKGNHISSEEFSKTMEVNIKGTYNCITQLSDVMSSYASIVNVSSVYGLISPDFRIYDGNEDLYNSSAYGASKAAIIQMTKYYAAQLAPIRVNAVSPGGIFQNHSRDFVEKYSKRVPLGRMADPKEIVNAIMFLLSPMSSYITGQNLVVDGGLSI